MPTAEDMEDQSHNRFGSLGTPEATEQGAAGANKPADGQQNVDVHSNIFQSALARLSPNSKNNFMASLFGGTQAQPPVPAANASVNMPPRG